LKIEIKGDENKQKKRAGLKDKRQREKERLDN